MRRLANGAEALEPPKDCAEFDAAATRWGVAPVLLQRLLLLGVWWQGNGYGTLWIISGWRSCDKNLEVGGVAGSDHTRVRNGRPYSIAADLGFDREQNIEDQSRLQAIGKCFGLETGFSFSDPDPNHVYAADLREGTQLPCT